MRSQDFGLFINSPKSTILLHHPALTASRAAVHSTHGQTSRRNCHEYIPNSCPSFQLNLMAYLPIGSAETGLAAGLNMGKAPGASLGGSPGFRPVFPRSSSHRA